jgi:hypothetical protein
MRWIVTDIGKQRGFLSEYSPMLSGMEHTVQLWRQRGNYLSNLLCLIAWASNFTIAIFGVPAICTHCSFQRLSRLSIFADELSLADDVPSNSH